MKYIMLKVVSRSGDERRLPVIFPDALIHQEVYEAMRHQLLRRPLSRPADVRVVSAGFLSASVVAELGRKSESLNIGPLGSDEAHINMIDYNHGII